MIGCSYLLFGKPKPRFLPLAVLTSISAPVSSCSNNERRDGVKVDVVEVNGDVSAQGCIHIDNVEGCGLTLPTVHCVSSSMDGGCFCYFLVFRLTEKSNRPVVTVPQRTNALHN